MTTNTRPNRKEMEINGYTVVFSSMNNGDRWITIYADPGHMDKLADVHQNKRYDRKTDSMIWDKPLVSAPAFNGSVKDARQQMNAINQACVFAGNMDEWFQEACKEDEA